MGPCVCVCVSLSVCVCVGGLVVDMRVDIYRLYLTELLQLHVNISAFYASKNVFSDAQRLLTFYCQL